MFGNANPQHIGNDGPSGSLAEGPDMGPDPIRLWVWSCYLITVGPFHSLELILSEGKHVMAQCQLPTSQGKCRLNKKETSQLLNHNHQATMKVIQSYKDNTFRLPLLKLPLEPHWSTFSIPTTSTFPSVPISASSCASACVSAITSTTHSTGAHTSTDLPLPMPSPWSLPRSMPF